jgi:hypothetical protein
MSQYQRTARKSAVFHIMYGYHPRATFAEMNLWRGWAARYINGEVDDVPLDLDSLRKCVASNNLPDALQGRLED